MARNLYLAACAFIVAAIGTFYAASLTTTVAELNAIAPFSVGFVLLSFVCFAIADHAATIGKNAR